MQVSRTKNKESQEKIPNTVQVFVTEKANKLKIEEPQKVFRDVVLPAAEKPYIFARRVNRDVKQTNRWTENVKQLSKMRNVNGKVYKHKKNTDYEEYKSQGVIQKTIKDEKYTFHDGKNDYCVQ